MSRKKKNLRYKKRRSICSDEVHQDRLRKILNYQLTQAFPDPVERQEYIGHLMKKMEK